VQRGKNKQQTPLFERKQFTPIELVYIGREIESDIQAEAKDRQVKGAKKGSGNLPEPNSNAGQTRDIVAKLLDTSGKTYEKAKAIVKAAERDREKFDKIPVPGAYLF
jgi:hypothetical protein